MLGDSNGYEHQLVLAGCQHRRSDVWDHILGLHGGKSNMTASFAFP